MQLAVGDAEFRLPVVGAELTDCDEAIDILDLDADQLQRLGPVRLQ